MPRLNLGRVKEARLVRQPPLRKRGALQRLFALVFGDCINATMVYNLCVFLHGLGPKVRVRMLLVKYELVNPNANLVDPLLIEKVL